VADEERDDGNQNDNYGGADGDDWAAQPRLICGGERVRNGGHASSLLHARGVRTDELHAGGVRTGLDADQNVADAAKGEHVPI